MYLLTGTPWVTTTSNKALPSPSPLRYAPTFLSREDSIMSKIDSAIPIGTASMIRYTVGGQT